MERKCRQKYFIILLYLFHLNVDCNRSAFDKYRSEFVSLCVVDLAYDGVGETQTIDDREGTERDENENNHERIK